MLILKHFLFSFHSCRNGNKSKEKDKNDDDENAFGQWWSNPTNKDDNYGCFCVCEIPRNLKKRIFLKIYKYQLHC